MADVGCPGSDFLITKTYSKIRTAEIEEWPWTDYKTMSPEHRRVKPTTSSPSEQDILTERDTTTNALFFFIAVSHLFVVVLHIYKTIQSSIIINIRLQDKASKSSYEKEHVVKNRRSNTTGQCKLDVFSFIALYTYCSDVTLLPKERSNLFNGIKSVNLNPLMKWRTDLKHFVQYHHGYWGQSNTQHV